MPKPEEEQFPFTVERIELTKSKKERKIERKDTPERKQSFIKEMQIFPDCIKIQPSAFPT